MEYTEKRTPRGCEIIAGNRRVVVTFDRYGGSWEITQGSEKSTGVCVWAASDDDVIRAAKDAAGINLYTIWTGKSSCPCFGASSITTARVIADRWPGSAIECYHVPSGLSEYVI